MRFAAYQLGIAALAVATTASPFATRNGLAQEHLHTPAPTSAKTEIATVPRAAAVQTDVNAADQALTLAELEQLAFQHNPTLVQAAAVIEAARGRAHQAGLPFNPTVGTQGEQIGADRTAGEWTWFYIQQEIVTGGKLRLSRLKYQQEACAAEVNASAQRLRVVNELAAAYYDVLAAQRSVENHRRQLENMSIAERTTKDLVNVGQANEQDLLQAQIEARQARTALRTAESRLQRDRDRLAAAAGLQSLPPRPFAGDLEASGPPLNRDESLIRILSESPELELARLEVKRDQIQLERERREPIPNLTVRAGGGYNYETRDNVGLIAVSVRLPVWDRNQGTIRQAQADLTRAAAEVSRVEFELRRRFADAYSRYESAAAQVEELRSASLPNAEKAVELYRKFFEQRRAAYPQVIVAERTLLQLREDLTRSLADVRRSEVEIRGLLLTGGLTAPRDPTPAGHINATPRPR